MTRHERAITQLLEAGFQKHEAAFRSGSYECPVSFDNGIAVRPRIVVDWDANLSMGFGLGYPAGRSWSPLGKCWRVVVRHGRFDHQIVGQALTLLQAAKVACSEMERHQKALAA